MDLESTLASMFAAQQREDPSASLGELAFRTLRETILRGHVRPDEKLSENQLAAAMGVSRTPIRQAIHMLETEGLVATRRHQITVHGFRLEELEEVFLVRRALEGLATELAAINLTDAELGELEEVVDLMEFYLQRRNYDALKQTGREFHQRIYNASRNKMLITMLATVWNVIESAREGKTPSDDGRADPPTAHRIILRALQDRDPLLARRLAEGHVMAVKERTLEVAQDD